ncbi:ribonuclease III [Desulfovibrio litoralis]|uniref:Ribonuclease 3 n=1 Tax=Desulfovibrio litoralis DSM 11393 TaxID=1121455 RepID=A0A1M7RYD8_9BACT|nr:ribonuclease III [Desulfovibrio litoralis]SHN51211.1 ribonuclease-3 [Desulfovibrio litoralis DSM 11393]
MYTTKFDQLQTAINYQFNNASLLRQALTHSSYSNEQNINAKNFEPNAHNERLEFLGDAVLQLSLSDQLYKTHSDSREGILTELRSQAVNAKSLANIAKKIKLDQYLLLGKGEENQGGRQRDNLLADALEALFGAIFLDSDFNNAQKIVCNLFNQHHDKKISTPKKQKDNKSLLQEITQKTFKATPQYKLIQAQGPEHEKTFHIQLSLPNGVTIESSSNTVKKAEQLAAEKALELLKQ